MAKCANCGKDVTPADKTLGDGCRLCGECAAAYNRGEKVACVTPWKEVTA